jgi:lysophospholipase L1-like esterase
LQQILVYADSLSWGIIPETRHRLPFEFRWPGVLEQMLNSKSKNVRVIENCLNGRRTVWEDPLKAGRNGNSGLAQVIEMHSPLDLVILMLGTNDFQCAHQNNAWLSAQGVNVLIQTIRSAPIEPSMPMPKILVVCPPKIKQPKGNIAPKFAGAELRDTTLPQELRTVCATQKVGFFDANSVIQASNIDGIHLDQADHQILGEALAREILERKFLSKIS